MTVFIKKDGAVLDMNRLNAGAISAMMLHIIAKNARFIIQKKITKLIKRILNMTDMKIPFDFLKKI
jgi:hypothetical protein